MALVPKGMLIRRVALGGVLIALLAIGAAYASAFAPGGAPGWAPWAMAVGLTVALAAALSSVSLPGSISFVTSIAPIAIAMGVPVAPLGLLVAVETFPDIFRTIGNVIADVAATKFAADGVGDDTAGEAP